MFRKFTDRLASAVNGTASSAAASNSGLESLVSLGFDSSAARRALTETNGNVDRAAELLLSRQGSNSDPPRRGQMSEDEQLQRAMQASLEATPASQQAPPKMPRRTAAGAKAAAAATNRANGERTPSVKLAETHPDVKLVPKFSSQSTEDQVLRSAQRFRGHAAAVDTIYRALRTVKDHPQESKYRTIDTNNIGYQRSVSPAPGTAQFLQAAGYQQQGTKMYLPQNYDPARLYLSISALEQVKETPEYITSKSLLNLDKEVASMQSAADSSTQEAIERSEFMQKLPSEPPVGRGAILLVQFGNSHNVSRRFDGDDTLDDVLNWLAASHGKALLAKLESGEWSLVDALRRESTGLDVARQGHSTLQYLGCWPSGKLQVAPTSTLKSVQSSSSRGLGSG